MGHTFASPPPAKARGKHADFVFVYRRERVKNLDEPPKMSYRRIDTMNNTAFQAARKEIGLNVRVHDFRHTFGQRLHGAGVREEDRNLLLGHASEEMAELYASAMVSTLIRLANKALERRERTTLLKVVNG